MPRRQELVALVPEAAAGLPTLPPQLRTHVVDGWTAITARPALSIKPGRKAVLKQAERRQTWLEALLPSGTVLPALPGTRIAAEDLAPVLAANHGLLQSAAARLKGRVQYQVTLSCDPREALRELAGGSGPFAGITTPDRMRMALSDYAAELLGALPGAELLALPRAEELVINTALLVPQSSVRQLDAALEQLDAIWSAGFTIRQIGPSPAVSFASLGARPIPWAAIKAAGTALGLAPGLAAPKEIQAARQAKLKAGAASPEQVRQAATWLELAHAWPRDEKRTRRALTQLFVWSEGQAARFSSAASSLGTELSEVA